MFSYIIGYNNPAAGGGVDVDRDWAAQEMDGEEFEIMERHAMKHGQATHGYRDLTILYKKG